MNFPLSSSDGRGRLKEFNGLGTNVKDAIERMGQRHGPAPQVRVARPLDE